MARRRKTKGRHARGRFSTIHPDAAGIDVGSRFHVVAVAPDRDAEPVRTFQSFTQDLHRLADWLHSRGNLTGVLALGLGWAADDLAIANDTDVVQAVVGTADHDEPQFQAKGTGPGCKWLQLPWCR